MKLQHLGKDGDASNMTKLKKTIAKSTKSRNGCLTCKKKRQKCDETKPACLTCQKKNLICGGYATNFKWKSFNSSATDETTSLQSPEEKNGGVGRNQYDKDSSVSSEGEVLSGTEKVNGKQKNVLTKHLELASLSMTGKSLANIKFENDLISRGINPTAFRKRKVSPETQATSRNNTAILTYLGDASQAVYNEESNRAKRRNTFSESNGIDNLVAEQMAGPMQRSLSTNNVNDLNIYLLRKGTNALNNGGLESLAEAAIDEMNTKRPHTTMAIESRGSDLSYPDSRDASRSRRNNSAPMEVVEDGVNGNRNTNLTTRSKPQVGDTPNSSSKFCSDEILGLMNLTPSLSALITYAFTFKGEDFSEDKNKYSENFHLHDVPSPIALSDETSVSSPAIATMVSGNSGFDWGNGQRYNSDATLGETKSTRTDAPVAVQNRMSSELENIDLLRAYNSTNKVPAKPIADLVFSKTPEKQQILFLYCQYTSSIMSIKNGPKENPWRTIIVPLAYKYSCLFNSLASMTLFHLASSSSLAEEKDHLRSRGYNYMKKCILELASGLSKMDDNDLHKRWDLPADVALVTCLNLAVSESWDTHTSSGIAHLKGAKSMIQKMFFLLERFKELSSKKRSLGECSLADNKTGSLEEQKEIKQKLILVEEYEWDLLLDDKNNINSGVGGKPHKPNSQSDVHNSSIIPKNFQFLFNVWIYFEVLAQMTSDTNHDDKGINLVATITTILQESTKKKENESQNRRGLLEMKANSPNEMSQNDTSNSLYGGFTSVSPGSVDNNSEKDGNAPPSLFDHLDICNFNNEYIDPLLGCSQSLFLIMGKVANLVSKTKSYRKDWDRSKGADNYKANTLSTISYAAELKLELLAWKPTIYPGMLDAMETNGLFENVEGTTTWDIPACVATAEAYRYATLLYLHQAVPEIPCLTSHQLAEKIFLLLASIPNSSQVHIVQIFPLLVSSCEASTKEERVWCERRWALLSDKMWIGNIDRAFEVVKEVWKRKDAHRALNDKEKVLDTLPFKSAALDQGNDAVRNISVELSGLMAAVSGDRKVLEDIQCGIRSNLHWSSIMKEWGWEVLLG